MPLQIIRQDITKLRCDAIVNAANSSLLGGGGVDGAIHFAAGPALKEECRTLGGCEAGQAKITKGYRLPCKYVIHTVGPVWAGGKRNEAALLASCYRESLKLAAEYQCNSVAFPLISAGAYGYPLAQAMEIATDTIVSFLDGQDMLVYLVVYDRLSFELMQERFEDVAAYIDQHYVDTHPTARSQPFAAPRAQSIPFTPQAAPIEAVPCSEVPSDLKAALGQIDESFSEMLLRKIDELGYTDSQCYKKANIDRKLFSKIRSDRNYRPSKPTALAFAIALELPLTEARELLQKAGFALSRSNKFDIIVEYFIRHGNYNIYEINEALFAFDQSLLGN